MGALIQILIWNARENIVQAGIRTYVDVLLQCSENVYVC